MWQADKARSDQYVDEVLEILRGQAYSFVRIIPANDYEDKVHNTDFEVMVEGGTIACRIRQDRFFRFRDVTIRNWRASGAKTEADKILEGYGRWMFYAWAGDRIERWALLNLDVVRRRQLIEKARAQHMITANKDGITSFIYLPLDWLSEAIEASHRIGGGT